MPTPKIFNHLLIFLSLYQHAKNQFIPSVHSSDTVSFSVQRSYWPYQLLTMPNQKSFSQILLFVTFYQLVENEAVS